MRKQTVEEDDILVIEASHKPGLVHELLDLLLRTLLQGCFLNQLEVLKNPSIVPQNPPLPPPPIFHRGGLSCIRLRA